MRLARFNGSVHSVHYIFLIKSPLYKQAYQPITGGRLVNYLLFSSPYSRDIPATVTNHDLPDLRHSSSVNCFLGYLFKQHCLIESAGIPQRSPASCVVITSSSFIIVLLTRLIVYKLTIQKQLH